MTDVKKLLHALQFTGDRKFKLKDFDPRDVSFLPDEKIARDETLENAIQIDKLQDKLFAEGKRSLLIVLQGIDSSGKDGTIKGVFHEVGPLGVSVTAFGKPSAEELKHDYLWRIHAAAPRRGTIGIFNRSHYESVLVEKVRKLADEKDIEKRYDQINAFEKMLGDNGTTILKFMLLISKKEQGERLQERLDDPKKNWKFQAGDLEDRKLWDDFMSAYETMVNRCSTSYAPWHVIPADRKWARNTAIAAITRAKLDEMNPKYPTPDWKPSDFKID